MQFNLNAPLPIHFIRFYSKGLKLSSRVYQLAEYVMEICLVHGRIMHMLPSELAALCLVFAIKVLTKENFPNLKSKTLMRGRFLNKDEREETITSIFRIFNIVC